MTDEQARDDLALIREAIEEGRGYATRCGPDMLVWGLAVALGYLGTYGVLSGWPAGSSRWIWAACIGLPWLYSLRGLGRRLIRDRAPRRGSPMVTSLRMLWLGCGIFLTTLGIAAMWSGDIRFGWFPAVVAGVMGVAVFGTAWLAGLPWLRWVAIAWWVGELAVFGLRHRPEALLVSAALMLALLAGPGLALVMRRQRLTAA